MNIQLNGKPIETEVETLEELISAYEYNKTTVATAVNKHFVPVSQRAEFKLHDDDCVEVIAPMSGG